MSMLHFDADLFGNLKYRLSCLVMQVEKDGESQMTPLVLGVDLKSMKSCSLLETA